MRSRLLPSCAVVALAVALAPGLARAWPVDWIHDVEVGKEKFLKLPKVDWFEVEDPKVLSVEWFPETNELVMTGLKAGRTRMLLGADGKVAAWRVRVGQKPALDEAAAAAARKACPTFRPAPSEEVKLTVTAHDEACRAALTALFKTDAFEARSLELEFEGKVLQAQLKAVQEALGKIAGDRLKARYVGAGLVVEGKVSQAEHRKMLWAILDTTLGRFALDDRTEVEPPPDVPDAGVPRSP